MERSVTSLLNLYHPEDPLEKASTIPSLWYFDPRIARLEYERVFARSWQVAGRVDQVRENGQFFTAQLGEEPIVVARGEDGILRAFYNVCRHHAVGGGRLALGHESRSGQGIRDDRRNYFQAPLVRLGWQS